MCTVGIQVPMEVTGHVWLKLELQVIASCWQWVMERTLGPLERQQVLITLLPSPTPARFVSSLFSF